MIKFIATISFILSLFQTLQSHEIDSLLKVLELNIQNKNTYESQKRYQIINTKELKRDIVFDTLQIFIINQRIIKEYEAFIFDSALYYSEINLKIAHSLNNNSLVIQTQILLANLLANSGRYKDAEDILSAINRKVIPNKLLPEYYSSLRNIYSILDFYTKVNQNKIKYHKKYLSFSDSLISIIDTNSTEYYAILETNLRDSRKLMACLEINSKRLNMTQMGDRDYSMITFERALAYEQLNDTINQKKYLILSAISDMKSAVKDNASLAILAKLLYHDKSINKAYEYINYAYEDANFYNSRLRFTEISNILPIINDTYKLKSLKQKKTLWALLLIISILSIGLIITVIKINNHTNKLNEAQNQLKTANQSLTELNVELISVNQKLNESNQVKDHYIGNFLTICSEYIDKLDKFRNLVNKHIINKQIQELFSKTKSTELIEEETREFYDNFDRIFLHIFPNFVTNINTLLAENEQIDFKDNERLNTELRIFALVRLGITDSYKIATLLRYSIRTIYNYRVKIKNKAINRDKFEEEIMNFGTNLK